MSTLDTGTEKLLVEIDDGIALLTFNQPEKHNAMSLAIRTALPPVLRTLQDDPAVRVIVLTGAGDRAFISGADISEFGDLRTSPEARAEFDRVAAEIAQAWRALEKPILAMIRGFCIGGGLLTAMQADIRIAAEDSQFAIPAARLGLGYGFPGVESLVALVGPAWAAGDSLLRSPPLLVRGAPHRAGQPCRPGRATPAHRDEAGEHDRGERSPDRGRVQGRGAPNAAAA